MDDFKLSMFILFVVLIVGAGVGIVVYQTIQNFSH